MLQEFNINDSWSVTGIYPIGSLYLSINATNPNVYFGGTWERFGKGKVLIGINKYDDDFSTVELVGGEKTHTLTTNELPKHAHSVRHITDTVASGSTSYPLSRSGSTMSGSGVFNNQPVGGGEAHNNLMPYATCYIWKRIA